MVKSPLTFVLLLIPLQFLVASNGHHPNFERGLQKFYALQLNQAQSYFQKAIQNDVDFWPAYQKLFQCYKALNRLDQAQQYFTQLQKAHPTNALPFYASGLCQFEKKNFTSAAKLFQKSVNLKPQFYDPILKLIISLNKSARLKKASQFFKQKIKARPQDGFAHYGLGIVLYFQGRFQQALSSFNKALTLNPHLLDAYRFKTEILRDQIGNLKDALTACDLGLARAQQRQDTDFIISFLLIKTSILLNDGQTKQAIEVNQTAIKESERAQFIDRKADALSNLGVIYRHTGANERALKVLHQCLSIFKTLNDAIGQEKALSNLGDIFVTTGVMDSARFYYETALTLAKKVNVTKDIAGSYGQLATYYFYTGNFNQSAAYSDSALTLYRQINDKPGLTTELGNMGTVYYIFGQYQKAIRYFDEAREYATQLGDKYLQQINLGNMGSIYTLLKDFNRAQMYLNQAYQIAKEMNSPSDEATWLGTLGTVWLALGDTTKAIQNFQNALTILKSVNDLRNMATTYANLGMIYTLQAKYAQAKSYFEQALQINQQIQNSFGLAETHNNLGTLFLQMGRYVQAQQQFKTALKQGQLLSSPKTIWDALFGLGKVEHKLKHLDQAIHYLKKAIKVVESIRGELISAELKTSFLTGKIEIYHQLIQLLYEKYQKNKSKPIMAEAFHFAEKAKARTLLDLLNESRIEIRKGVKPELLATEKKLMQNISQLQTQLATTPLTTQERKNLLKLLRKNEDELQKIRTEIRQENPFYAQLKFPSVTHLNEVQKHLPEHTYLLEYIFARPYSYLWVIGRHQSQWIQLASEINLGRQINRYLKMIGQPPAMGLPVKTYGARLGQLLLPEEQITLPANTTLIIVPDGQLLYLPFETLVVKNDHLQNDYLIQTHPISYASSASVWLFLRQRLKSTHYNGDLLAFGDPVFSVKDTMEDVNLALYRERGLGFKRLPYTSDEIKTIARYFSKNKAKIYLRSQATEENLKAECNHNFRILHFATHGMIDEHTPERSCILLTIDNDPQEDGFLQVQEIFNLKLNTQLVTLSACQTGKGKLVQGEGIIGFAQAFYYAGARSLLVSLWPVTDQSTAKLMNYFYGALHNGLSQVRALQQAKLKFIFHNQQALHHPYFWAPFVLHGSMEFK